MSLTASDFASRAPLLTPRRVELALDLIRYGGCSAAALTLDYGLLLLLSQEFGVHYLLAAAIGFLSGLVLAYALTITFVFKGRRTLSAPREFTGFAAIGIAGLGLTQALLAYLVGGLGLSVAIAKLMAAVVVFIFNFGLRRATLFVSGTVAASRQKLP